MLKSATLHNKIIIVKSIGNNNRNSVKMNITMIQAKFVTGKTVARNKFINSRIHSCLSFVTLTKIFLVNF